MGPGNEVYLSYHVLQVSHQLGTLMDWFSTALDLAHVKEPSDRTIDGISLLPLFYKGTITNRSHRVTQMITLLVISPPHHVVVDHHSACLEFSFHCLIVQCLIT